MRNLQTSHLQVLPPPKWKLWLVIWFSVFTISLAFTDANVQQGLMDDGWLDFEPALFVRLFISVTFIIYAYVSPSHLKMHFVSLREQLPRTVLRTPQKIWFQCFSRLIVLAESDIVAPFFSCFRSKQ
jgi:ABC-type polysaccharide transport system permease subunit